MEKTKNKIVFVHSLNNFSGSTNVLSTIIKELSSKGGYDIDIITSKGEGFLSNISDVNYVYTPYRWLSGKLSTLFLLLVSQFYVFGLICLKYRKGDYVFYINTIIPFGAAWACFFMKKKRIYHVHENMLLKKPLYFWYRYTYRICNTKSIFVSAYLFNLIHCKRDSIIVYNSLSNEFKSKFSDWIISKKKVRKNIVMISSLNAYKGVFEFIKLAQLLPQYPFQLILSTTLEESDKFKNKFKIPKNLLIFPQQNDISSIYGDCRILLNLSHVQKLPETFGMTILEAMYYGIPSIVPTVGGPLELIEDGVNGFTINSFDMYQLIEKIELLMTDDIFYNMLSASASMKAKSFDVKLMVDKIENYILN